VDRGPELFDPLVALEIRYPWTKPQLQNSGLPRTGKSKLVSTAKQEHVDSGAKSPRVRARKMTPSKTVLTLVGSAGIDPWLSIENEAQQPIIENLSNQPGQTVWFNGDAAVSGRWASTATLVQAELDLMYCRPRFLRDALRRRWAASPWNSIAAGKLQKFLSHQDNHEPTALGGDRFQVNFPVQRSLAGLRTIQMLRFAYENYHFDYLLRITSTCLPVPRNLARDVSDLPRDRVYAGYAVRFMGTEFVSGAAMILSRDVVEKIIDRSEKFLFTVYEDVALARLIQEYDLADVIRLSRTDINSASMVPNQISRAWPPTSVIRCKVESQVTTVPAPVINLMNLVAPHLK